MAFQKHHKAMCEVLDISFEDGKITGMIVQYPEEKYQSIRKLYSVHSNDFWLYDNGVMVFELLQCIGIMDRNAVDVYEKSIVEDNIGIGFVEYVDGAFRVNYNNGRCKWFIDYLDSEIKTIEVLGNKLEHTHLLKEGEVVE